MKNIKSTGKQYWRSLDQLADTPEFRQLVEREFPEGASELDDKFSRRKFLSLMGASIALAGLAGCRRPVEKIIPFVTALENNIPGVPKYYATTMPFGLESIGLMVENHEGRPTKLEGNKLHPASLGASTANIQAAILNLYDPDRSKAVRFNGSTRSWNDFVSAWKLQYAELKESNGEGFAILSESFASPTLARLKTILKTSFPKMTWVTYDPVSDENIFKGIENVAGKSLQPVYDFSSAKVILSLDNDFLSQESQSISNTKGFSAGRKVKSEKDDMNRLYVVENNFSITGSMADHRVKISSGQIPRFLAALAYELQQQDLILPGVKSKVSNNFDQDLIKALAKDLIKHKGESLVVAGRRQPEAVHGIVLAINSALKNINATVRYRSFTNADLPDTQKLSDLVKAMKNGKISRLVIFGGNPVYNSPVDLEFDSALKKVAFKVQLSDRIDETTGSVNWHIPRANFLESWGDAQSVEGSRSIIQPQIEPLFGAHSDVKFLGVLANGEEISDFKLVRDTWKKFLPSTSFESSWKKVLHDGIEPKPKSNWVGVSIKTGSVKNYYSSTSKYVSGLDKDNIEINLTSSYATFDGRFANNGWMQEAPDPISKLTWDNAAVMNRKTAEALGLSNSELADLTVNGRTLRVPVWIVPGSADFTISIALGYGREAAGQVGNGVGFNTFAIRSTDALYYTSGASIQGVGEEYVLACTQDHHGFDLEEFASEAIEKRLPMIFREATLEEYHEEPDFVDHVVHHPPLESLWEERKYDEGYQWGMSIDLNLCNGCNACSIACQSENNIPIVGKEEVSRGREMAWMRMDRYFTGDEENPEMVYQPVACQHCENAPCEQVCPVAATVHDEEGLNVMTYNRCVGTRYCANNCPYKVRRFNFFNYTKDTPDIVEMAMNPDVTVRFRGVMEKCSYCTQRISLARIQSKNEDRSIQDGDVVSACMQSCPADAIVFGNINDPESEVSRVKEQNRDYALLGELNTKPRTTYLAKLRNPNPELVN